MRHSLLAATLALVAVLAVPGTACKRSDREGTLGTVQLGTRVDPRFDEAWRALSARAGDEDEVFYIEDDRGEGLMGRVRRARGVPKAAPPPQVAPEGRPPSGELEAPSGDQVIAVVRSNLPAVKTCYLRITRSGSAVSGRAIVSFTVNKEGSAGDVRVDAPAFERTDLPRCMTQQIQRWEFPRSRRGGVAVSYPFVFVGG
jgi:hypothetical protein